MSRKVVLGTIIGIIVAAIVIGVVAYSFLRAPSKTATRPSAPSRAPPSAPKLTLAWESRPLIPTSNLLKMGLYDRAYSWWDILSAPVKVSPDGKYVVVLAQNYKVYIFEALNGKLLKVL